MSHDPEGHGEPFAPPDEGSYLPVLREEDAGSETVRRATDAQMYARLLVSDIRLYHEEEVILGRATYDLRERLGDSIAAARATFLRRFDDDRVFESAIVLILAGGDPRKLG